MAVRNGSVDPPTPRGATVTSGHGGGRDALVQELQPGRQSQIRVTIPSGRLSKRPDPARRREATFFSRGRESSQGAVDGRGTARGARRRAEFLDRGVMALRDRFGESFVGLDVERPRLCAPVQPRRFRAGVASPLQEATNPRLASRYGNASEVWT